MKRLLSVFLLCLVFLSACSSASPESAVRAFLDAAARDDRAAVENALLLTEEEKENYFYGLDSEEVAAFLFLQKLSSAFGAYQSAALEKSKIAVKSCVIEEDLARVTVSGSAVLLDGFVASLVPKVREEMTLQALNGKDVSVSFALEIVLTRLIAQNEFPAVQKEWTLELKKKDGEWKILPSPAVTTLCTLDLTSDPDAVFSAFSE